MLFLQHIQHLPHQENPRLSLGRFSKEFFRWRKKAAKRSLRKVSLHHWPVLSNASPSGPDHLANFTNWSACHITGYLALFLPGHITQPRLKERGMGLTPRLAKQLVWWSQLRAATPMKQCCLCCSNFSCGSFRQSHASQWAINPYPITPLPATPLSTFSTMQQANSCRPCSREECYFPSKSKRCRFIQYKTVFLVPNEHAHLLKYGSDRSA